MPPLISCHFFHFVPSFLRLIWRRTSLLSVLSCAVMHGFQYHHAYLLQFWLSQKCFLPTHIFIRGILKPNYRINMASLGHAYLPSHTDSNPKLIPKSPSTEPITEPPSKPPSKPLFPQSSYSGSINSAEPLRSWARAIAGTQTGKGKRSGYDYD